VKGSPLRIDKLALRDGQKFEEKERVMFTTIKDVVILMNSHFTKIYLKPKNQTELKKLVKVNDFIQNLSVAEIKLRGASTRGTDAQSLFQSLFDILRIHMIQDLKLTANQSAAGFKLLNVFMEDIPNGVKPVGETQVITPPKAGMYYLHIGSGNQMNQTLAEIEFLEKEEVMAELKFVAKSANPADSSQSIQIRYLRKIYPNVFDNQMNSVVIRN